jgi:hypothetical protein
MFGAGGLRGRRRRRQEMRCEGYCGAMLSALLTVLSPAQGSGHTHEKHAAQGAHAHECLRYLSSRGDVEGTLAPPTFRSCRQLSQKSTQTRATAARKVLASLS